MTSAFFPTRFILAYNNRNDGRYSSRQKSTGGARRSESALRCPTGMGACRTSISGLKPRRVVLVDQVRRKASRSGWRKVAGTSAEGRLIPLSPPPPRGISGRIFDGLMDAACLCLGEHRIEELAVLFMEWRVPILRNQGKNQLADEIEIECRYWRGEYR